MVDGVAVTAAESGASDGAVVALMDTGVYPTAAGRPFPNARDAQTAALLEAHRMGEYTVGPWQVDDTLRARGDLTVAGVTGPMAVAKFLGDNSVLPDPLPSVAAAHGYYHRLRHRARHTAGSRPTAGIRECCAAVPRRRLRGCSGR